MTRIAKTAVLAMAAMAFAGMAPAPMTINPSTTIVVSAPQEAPRPAPQQQAPSNEVTRVARLSDVPMRRHRLAWDGKNRSAGDRAHKRMKRRRASGR